MRTGLARGNGQMANDIFDQHLLLDAKAAANARLDDANSLWRQAQQAGRPFAGHGKAPALMCE